MTLTEIAPPFAEKERLQPGHVLDKMIPVFRYCDPSHKDEMKRGEFSPRGREWRIQGAGLSGFYFSADAEEHARRFEQANEKNGVFVYYVTPEKQYSLDDSRVKSGL